MWPAVKLTAEQLGYKFDCDGRAGRMNITIAACQRQGEKQGLMNSGVWPICWMDVSSMRGPGLAMSPTDMSWYSGGHAGVRISLRKNILQFQLQIFKMRGV